MTNEQIIEEIAISVFGEGYVSQVLKAGRELPLHTVRGWAERGPFRVKKGEHGIECYLWKKKTRKSVEGNEEIVTAEVPNNKDFYLCKSYLFTREQVERGLEA